MAEYTVKVRKGGFEPPNLRIKVGDVVRWLFVDGGQSIATRPVDAHVDSLYSGRPGAQGTEYKHQFAVPGTVVYHCVQNGDLKASVVVALRSPEEAVAERVEDGVTATASEKPLGFKELHPADNRWKPEEATPVVATPSPVETEPKEPEKPPARSAEKPKEPARPKDVKPASKAPDAKPQPTAASTEAKSEAKSEPENKEEPPKT